MSGAIILVNGYPGVGKLTVSHELAVIDMNHIHQLALGISSPSTPEYKKIKDEMETTILRGLLENNQSTAQSNPIYIIPCTHYSPLSTTSSSTILKYLNLLSSYTIIHVILSCSTETNIQRITDPSRQVHSKQTGEDELMEIKMEEEIIHLQSARKERRSKDAEKVSGEYEIDTSFMSSLMAAGVVGEYVIEGMRNAGVFVSMVRRGSR